MVRESGEAARVLGPRPGTGRPRAWPGCFADSLVDVGAACDVELLTTQPASGKAALQGQVLVRRSAVQWQARKYYIFYTILNLDLWLPEAVFPIFFSTSHV